MNVLIAEKIASIEKGNGPIIVAICGAADLGKSYLSKEVVKSLSVIGISANHLTLDSFLIERSERLRQGISGYQIEAYEQKSAMDALSKFKQRKSILYAPYDHETGKRSFTLETLKPSSVLILDGVQSMHGSFSSYIDFSVFIYTEDEVLKKIRYEADLTKRKYTTELAKCNSEPEFIEYKKQLEPYRIQANLRLFLKTKWIYIIDK